MMFENAKLSPAAERPPANGRPDGQRFAPRAKRRAGDALRAVEWSELTARLNAARDLRLLMRTESHAPIEQALASFGDAAASYFALLDHDEPDVNPDTLGQSKTLGAMPMPNDTNRPDAANGSPSVAQPQVMREKCND